MSSGRNTDEYRKVISVTPKLTEVLSDGNNVIELSGKLLKAGLISKANNTQMTNQFVDADIRAAKLIGMVTTKVDLSSRNFHTFVDVLKTEEATYGTILDELYPARVVVAGDTEERVEADQGEAMEQENIN